MEYFLCLSLFAIGLYAVITKRNMIKILIGVAIMGYAIDLLFLLVSNRHDAGIPILHTITHTAPVADPLVQAAVLITVILGLALTLILGALAVRLFEKYGTVDITKMQKLKG